MEPSDRDIYRELRRVGSDPDDPDPADMWEALITGKHPDDMDSKAEADAIRKAYLEWSDPDALAGRDLDDMSELDVEKLDELIRRRLEV